MVGRSDHGVGRHDVASSPNPITPIRSARSAEVAHQPELVRAEDKHAHPLRPLEAAKMPGSMVSL